jgi:UPF0042 nucleotide-binding protein
MSRQLIVISGLSGSGKSTAARALEDAGCFVIDNLPLVMLPDLLTLTGSGHERVAIVVDARSSAYLGDCQDLLQQVAEKGYAVDILFLDTSEHDLVKRFSETRRRHPLLEHEHEDILSAISRERELTAQLKQLATIIIDSTGLNVHQLRQQVLATIFGAEGGEGRLQITLESFGFRHGLPLGADLVFDVRFLDNPHFVEELRPQTGLSPAVSAYVLSQDDYQTFRDRLKDLLLFLLPRYRQEGKSSLTIGIGCTGGRHRSVAIAEDLAPYLFGAGCPVQVRHRDIDSAPSAAADDNDRG